MDRWRCSRRCIDSLTGRIAGCDARLVDSRSELGVRFAFDPIYSHLVIWTPRGRAVRCARTVTNPNDGFTPSSAGVPGTGVFVLEPGEERGGSFLLYPRTPLTRFTLTLPAAEGGPMFPAVLIRTRTEKPLLALPSGRTYSFPESFVWGAATAAHQVEGQDSGSDWWKFEREPGRAPRFLAASEFAKEYKSDHWRRFSEDIRRMRDELGLNGYRFSVDWSRVEPREGEFDPVAIERYATLCAEMQAAGIRPCVTLFHWSSPEWIWERSRETESGWYAPGIVDRFSRFCEKIVPAVAPHVDLFCTLNEPNMFLFGGFVEGMLAPGHKRSDEHLFPVVEHLLESHVRAHRIIKSARPDAQVGVAQHFYVFEPESRGNPLAGIVAAQAEQAFTWAIPDALHTGRITMRTRSGKVLSREIPGLAGSADFTGLNYYERALVRLPKAWNPLVFEVLHDHRDTKEIWPKEISTAGFVDVLVRAHKRYGLPIYVTENGRAHTNDEERERYLEEHVRAMGHARTDLGVDVRGYFYWSLLDNQEWAYGFLPRLGLYAVDFENGERTLRETGRTYARIARERSVST